MARLGAASDPEQPLGASAGGAAIWREADAALASPYGATMGPTASGLRPRGPSGRRSRLARLRWSAAIEYGPSPLSSRTEFATLPLLAAPDKCACLPLRAVPEIARGNAWPNSFEKTRGSERPSSSPGNSPGNRQRRRGSRPFFASSRFGASLCGAPTVAPPM